MLVAKVGVAEREDDDGRLLPLELVDRADARRRRQGDAPGRGCAPGSGSLASDLGSYGKPWGGSPSPEASALRTTRGGQGGPGGANVVWVTQQFVPEVEDMVPEKPRGVQRGRVREQRERSGRALEDEGHEALRQRR